MPRTSEKEGVLEKKKKKMDNNNKKRKAVGHETSLKGDLWRDIESKATNTPSVSRRYRLEGDLSKGTRKDYL